MATKRTDARRLSRRTLLIAAACVGGGGRVVGAAGKLSKSAVAYQDQPHGNERCEICAPYLPPDQCRLVAGPVSRQGWCKVYAGPKD
jgi:hypothetical protein